MGKYDDIINCKRPVSGKHPQMPLENRAAQFAPFAALTGYDDAVAETARLTDKKAELSEDLRQELDRKLSEITAMLDSGKKVTISAEYFEEDSLKEGGKYVTKQGMIKRVDMYRRQILFNDKSSIAIDDIASINVADFFDE